MGSDLLTFHPLAGIFPLLEGEPFQDFIDDIYINGLHEPIVLHEGMILDGRNRYRACLKAGVEARFETYEGNDPLAYVVSLNLRRRHLDESQRAMVAARIATLQHGGVRASGQLAACPTQAKAAEMLNVGERSVRRAREVLDQGVPELAEAVDRGAVAVSFAEQIARLPKEEQREIVANCDKKAVAEVYKKLRAEKIEETRAARLNKIVAISRGNRPLDTSVKYPVIYADPPWRYENPPMSNSQIENHYPTMTNDEICALPVSDLATPDSILYLWATAPMLYWCMRVIDAWHFQYRTNFAWVKDKWGMGFHARNQHELLLVATRGEIPPPAPADRVSSVIFAPRGRHSEKPAEVYELIESFYPTLPKVELFCSRSS
jgi:N6-adenosine-specific RNA methylase IME4